VASFAAPAHPVAALRPVSANPDPAVDHDDVKHSSHHQGIRCDDLGFSRTQAESLIDAYLADFDGLNLSLTTSRVYIRQLLDAGLDHMAFKECLGSATASTDLGLPEHVCSRLRKSLAVTLIPPKQAQYNADDAALRSIKHYDSSIDIFAFLEDFEAATAGRPVDQQLSNLLSKLSGAARTIFTSANPQTLNQARDALIKNLVSGCGTTATAAMYEDQYKNKPKFKPSADTLAPFLAETDQLFRILAYCGDPLSDSRKNRIMGSRLEQDLHKDIIYASRALAGGGDPTHEQFRQVTSGYVLATRQADQGAAVTTTTARRSTTTPSAATNIKPVLAVSRDHSYVHHGSEDYNTSDYDAEVVSDEPPQPVRQQSPGVFTHSRYHPGSPSLAVTQYPAASPPPSAGPSWSTPAGGQNFGGRGYPRPQYQRYAQQPNNGLCHRCRGAGHQARYCQNPAADNLPCYLHQDARDGHTNAQCNKQLRQRNGPLLQQPAPQTFVPAQPPAQAPPAPQAEPPRAAAAPAGPAPARPQDARFEERHVQFTDPRQPPRPVLLMLSVGHDDLSASVPLVADTISVATPGVARADDPLLSSGSSDPLVDRTMLPLPIVDPTTVRSAAWHDRSDFPSPRPGIFRAPPVSATSAFSCPDPDHVAALPFSDPVAVIYGLDDPRPTRQPVTCEFTIAGVKHRVRIDTHSAANLVDDSTAKAFLDPESKTFCSDAVMAPANPNLSLCSATNSPIRLVGQLILPIQLGAGEHHLAFNVSSSFDGFGLLLGDPCLHMLGARIDYERQEVCFNAFAACAPFVDRVCTVPVLAVRGDHDQPLPTPLAPCALVFDDVDVADTPTSQLRGESPLQGDMGPPTVASHELFVATPLTVAPWSVAAVSVLPSHADADSDLFAEGDLDVVIDPIPALFDRPHAPLALPGLVTLSATRGATLAVLNATPDPMCLHRGFALATYAPGDWQLLHDGALWPPRPPLAGDAPVLAVAASPDLRPPPLYHFEASEISLDAPVFPGAPRTALGFDGVPPSAADDDDGLDHKHVDSPTPTPDAPLDTETTTQDESAARETFFAQFTLNHLADRSDHAAQLKHLLWEQRDAFSNTPGYCSVLPQSIKTTGPPTSRPFRQQPPAVREVITSQIKTMLKDGVIEPSCSPYSAPVVIVTKKDGTPRFCVNYRALNEQTIKDKFPMPDVQTALSSLGTGKFFSSLDLTSGFHQIALTEESKHKTAFTVHDGHYQYRVSPQGLVNSPAAFQRVMNVVLADLHWLAVLIYLDDILVFSATFEDHLKHLEGVFTRLRSAGLTIKPAKCQFLMDRLVYLGHCVSPEGVSVDPRKVAVIKELPTPSDVTPLRQFLGMTSYYRRFVLGYALVARPLYNLLKDKTPYEWTDDCKAAFTKLRDALCSAPILAHPNFNYTFIIQTDASDIGLGGVLCQRIDGVERPVCYISRVLQPAESKWSVREREALGIMWAIESFRCYVFGSHFIVETDHRSLQWLLDAEDPYNRLARWRLRLAEFSFTIVYRKGSGNANADALSRLISTTNDAPVLLVRPSARPLFVPTPSVPIPVGDRWPPVSIVPPAAVFVVTRRQTAAAAAPAPIPAVVEDAPAAEIPPPDESKAVAVPVSAPPASRPPNFPDVAANSLPHLDRFRKDQKFDEVLKLLRAAVLNDAETLSSLPDATRAVLAEKARRYAIDPDTDLLYYLATDIHDKIPSTASADNVPAPMPPVPLLAVPVVHRDAFLYHFHVHPLAGHLGRRKTLNRLRRGYYWLGISRDVARFVRGCSLCVRRKTSRPVSAGLLQITRQTEPFARIGMDLTGPFPLSSRGNRYAVVIVDHFTHWVELFAVAAADARSVAEGFFEYFVTRHGVPLTILTDLGSNFMSDFWARLMRRLGIRHVHTTAYHPQTNGITERFNRYLKAYLAVYIRQDQTNWDAYLQSAAFAYRTSVVDGIQESPFYLVYGRDARLPVDVIYGPYREIQHDVSVHRTQLTRTLHRAYSVLLQNADASAARRKVTYDASHRDVHYDVGSLVIVWAPVRRKGRSAKLMMHWTGPWRVLRQHSPVNFVVRRLSDNVERTVHVQRMALFVPYEPYVPLSDIDAAVASVQPDEIKIVDRLPRSASSQPEPAPVDESATYNIEQILAYRIIRRKGVPVREFRCLWQGYSLSAATWEPEDHLIDQLPEHLHEFLQYRGLSIPPALAARIALLAPSASSAP
jgi:transposase InsO family protein